MIRSLAVGLYSVFLGLRFWRDLAIQSHEGLEYLSKLFSLGALYSAFVKPPTSRGFVGAGRAAFLCCAYDVVTDWRGFSSKFREPFEKQLQRLVPEWAVELTMELYWVDRFGTLSDDGLERGGIAVEFITGVVGSRAYFSAFGVKRLGQLLQIVDDVLDLEHDVDCDEMNCLVSPRATKYLEILMESQEEMVRLFRRDRTMCFAIVRAGRKARSMLWKLTSEG
jgi:hypothetical protein